MFKKKEISEYTINELEQELNRRRDYKRIEFEITSSDFFITLKGEMSKEELNLSRDQIEKYLNPGKSFYVNYLIFIE